MTTDQVKKLHEAGLTTKQIAAELDIATATVSYHKKKLGVAIQQSFEIDWTAVAQDLFSGATQRDILRKYKIGIPRFQAAISEGLVPDVIAKGAVPLSEVLVVGSPYPRVHLKRRLLAENLLERACALCGIGAEWQGKPLVHVLDHINGINDDNRLENLRMLCPNCNSQTETFSGRNVRKSNVSG